MVQFSSGKHPDESYGIPLFYLVLEVPNPWPSSNPIGNGRRLREVKVMSPLRTGMFVQKAWALPDCRLAKRRRQSGGSVDRPGP